MHAEFVILAFAPQQQLRERAWMLRLYIRCVSSLYICGSCVSKGPLGGRPLESVVPNV